MSKETICEQQQQQITNKQQKRKRSVVPGSACQNHAAQESEIYRNMEVMEEEDQTERNNELIFNFPFTQSRRYPAPASFRAEPCGVQAVRGTVSGRIWSVILHKAPSDNRNSCLLHWLCC